jgi:Ser/Thr protein kinase RdoA (MazF antagonist)
LNTLASRRRHENIGRVGIDDILAEYDLDLVGAPVPLPSQGRGRSILVPTSRGKKIVKQYKSTVLETAIAHEHSILKYLSEIDFPSPRLVATNTGETVLQRSGEKYAVFDYIKDGVAKNMLSLTILRVDSNTSDTSFSLDKPGIS